MGVRLYVGGHAGTVQGERENLNGDRMMSAAHRPQIGEFSQQKFNAMLDSGAFTDPPEKRLTPEAALERQLKFEEKAKDKWKFDNDWFFEALVSYDLLIDETWVGKERIKKRWNLLEAEKAVEETIMAAKYLSGQRERLQPRRLVLSAQGVDSVQYAECVDEILKFAQPTDIIGLGGWCILGLHKSMLPEFWRTLDLILPKIASKGISRIHIFGVLWQKAIGGLLYLADEHDLKVSTDSTAPILNCTCQKPENRKRAGARAEYWRDNVQWWIDSLQNLRASEFYQMPEIRRHLFTA